MDKPTSYSYLGRINLDGFGGLNAVDILVNFLGAILWLKDCLQLIGCFFFSYF